MLTVFRRLLRPIGVINSVQQNYGFIRVEGPSSAEKDVVVLSFVNELVGRDVDFLMAHSAEGKPRIKHVRLCGKTESKGQILRYNIIKGFGVVKTNADTEVSFGREKIVGFDGFLTHLTVGQRVAFEVTEDVKGRCATHLRAIGSDALEHKNPASPQKGFVVMHGYKYVRPEGETTGANDLLVPMFVQELAGRDVDFEMDATPEGKPPRVKDIRLCDKADSKGQLLRYSIVKGFGVVRTTDGTECLFDSQKIIDFGDCLTFLTIGQKVEFQVTEWPTGRVATHYFFSDHNGRDGDQDAGDVQGADPGGRLAAGHQRQRDVPGPPHRDRRGGDAERHQETPPEAQTQAPARVAVRQVLRLHLRHHLPAAPAER
jgi:cold shock CspA family protein